MAMTHTSPDEIENGKPRKREPLYYTIPRSEWVQTEASQDGAQKVQAAINKISTSPLIRTGVAKSASEYESGQIIVRYDTIPGQNLKPDISIDRLKDYVPNSVDGTAKGHGLEETVKNISVKVVSETLSFSADVSDGENYDYIYPPAPAGAKIAAYNDYTGSQNYGTITCPAYDYDLYEYITLTVSHLFGEGGEGEFSLSG
jgi:hypothetical protein